LTAKQLRLEQDSPAIGNGDGRRKAVTIPAGSIITVVAEPHDVDGMVKVRWHDQSLEMFAVDLGMRETEVTGPNEPRDQAAASRAPLADG